MLIGEQIITYRRGLKSQIHITRFIGALDTLEKIPEWRVETIVPEEKASVVAKALKASHPYEEPALEFVQIVDVL